MGMSWHAVRPHNPQLGDCYLDMSSMNTYTWTGTAWIQLGSGNVRPEKPEILIPTATQLENHPALKQAWEEYLVIRRLIGSGKE